MELYTSVDIAAPPARVWELLTDFAGYDRWNPLLRRMRGRPEIGATVRFHAVVGRAPVPLTAEVVLVERERELVWIGPARPRWARRLIAGEHWFRLEPIGGSTRFEHGEHFTGAAVPNSAPRFERFAKPAYDAMNRALKREAEAARA